jgi:hypothetical protein
MGLAAERALQLRARFPNSTHLRMQLNHGADNAEVQALTAQLLQLPPGAWRGIVVVQLCRRLLLRDRPLLCALMGAVVRVCPLLHSAHSVLAPEILRALVPAAGSLQRLVLQTYDGDGEPARGDASEVEEALAVLPCLEQLTAEQGPWLHGSRAWEGLCAALPRLPRLARLRAGALHDFLSLAARATSLEDLSLCTYFLGIGLQLPKVDPNPSVRRLELRNVRRQVGRQLHEASRACGACDAVWSAAGVQKHAATRGAFPSRTRAFASASIASLNITTGASCKHPPCPALASARSTWLSRALRPGATRTVARARRRRACKMVTCRRLDGPSPTWYR